MKHFYSTLLLLQVASFALSAVIYNRNYGEDGSRLRRQATGSNWINGPFSDCSVTCGGGFRVRSVRCLDEDGVISFSCPTQAPANYEICNQVDCNTGNPITDLPSSGITIFNMPNSILEFTNSGSGNFRAVVNTTESDGTRTVVTDDGSPTQTTTTRSVFASQPTVVVDGSRNLQVNGNQALDLNNIMRTEIPSGETIQLVNNMVVLSDGTVLAPNVNLLTYFDRFRFYNFSGSTVNPFSGPGVFYLNPTTGETLYSVDINFNTQIDNQLILTTAAPPPATVAPPPATVAPPPATVAPPPATVAPPPATVAPPPATVAPPPATASPQPPVDTVLPPVTTSTPDVPATTEDMCEENTRTKKSKKSKKKRGKKSKSRRRSRQSDNPCQEDEVASDSTTKSKTKKSKSSKSPKTPKTRRTTRRRG